MRRLDAQIREPTKKLAIAVYASGTKVTEIFGAGPVIAATVTGDAGGVARFASRDHFAACNGTAPIAVSCGNRKIYRRPGAVRHFSMRSPGQRPGARGGGGQRAARASLGVQADLPPRRLMGSMQRAAALASHSG